MFARQSIRKKLTVWIGLLWVTVALLAAGAFCGVYSYRSLARGVRQRASELPLATELARHVSDLRVALIEARQPASFPHYDERAPHTTVGPTIFRDRFRESLLRVEETLQEYQRQLRDNEQAPDRIGDSQDEWDKVAELEEIVQWIKAGHKDESWIFEETELGDLKKHLAALQDLSAQLPKSLHDRMVTFAGDVKLRYRTWIVMIWTTSLLAGLLTVLLLHLFNGWVLRPLRVLVHGSRRVASGVFDHRIHLESHDEMAELAQAMNMMTDRFQQIRDDLDRQVRQRTREVVRSEQLASVGFLAAGVAHEINNPLAAIAISAESLEQRVTELIGSPSSANAMKPSAAVDADGLGVVQQYLKMIQTEAFRCKGITDRLLDFSRLGEVERQDTNLVELTESVIEMVRHLGRNREKEIRFHGDAQLRASVHPQEIKQVMLNLITNALDSIDPGGLVQIEITERDHCAVLRVCDNGCGMSEEVQEHLFEPFFTRRRDGQGTGLGLSITYRIVAEHGGHIDVHSDGPGKGSTLTVTIPLTSAQTKEIHDYHQAA